MDYKERYENAINRAKEYLKDGVPDRVDTKGIIFYLFPELSEDKS